MTTQPTTAPADGNFATTRWTQVLRARGETVEAQKALSELCEAYWTPVFRFLRREGRDEDTARELTQEFFARLIARHGLATVQQGRGRFRSFLLGAVKHFLADMRDHERRLKRGGGATPEPLASGNGTETELQISDPSAAVPDTFFDRQWAFTVMERGLVAVEREFESEGKRDQFAVLKPWLVGETEALPQAEAARRLDLTEGAVKVAIHRLRKRFRELIRAEIAQTIDDPVRLDEELRYLVEVLSAT
ncbi:MAG: sigma-70 family RNA polymerase sigma factor [Verrucomicrobia bacterium]|nr:sigma-70 family RNA polymerase sigma factor [Verrucomicrobiota bacterium]